MPSLRCFVGIPLSETASSSLLKARDAISALDRSWEGEKWVAPENLHITVHFLGSLEQDAAEALARVLDESLCFETFRLQFESVVAVPGARRCRMIWARFLDPNGACAALAEDVQGVALGFGVPLDERPFIPHATLCRSRRPRPLAATALSEANVATTGFESMSVGRAMLFASRLSPRGPEYSVLREWRARGE